MANGILGLGQGQAATLNSDLIEKLKAADKKATVDPLEEKLEKITSEKEVISNIGTKVDDLLNAVKIFSLNQTTSVNAFNQKSASVTGDGVVFDAPDLTALKTGSLSVKVEQLAQKDAWQTDVINDAKSDKVNLGEIVINGTTIDTTDLTYEEFAKEINKIDGVQASLVDTSDGKFRLSIKSTDTGEANKISFTGGDGLGLTNVLVAQDMKMKVDGVDYSSSSNTVMVDGLKITAAKTGAESTINIEEDSSSLAKQMQDFVDAYNALRAEIENEVYSSESSVQDKSTLKDMLSQIKNHLFGSGNSEVSMFSFGFSFNEKSGDIVFNSNEFEQAIKGGTKELEALFSGVAEKKGIATLIDETISVSGVKKGLIDYELNMLSREETLKKEKETAETTLDNKYSMMAQQFASYGVIINQMEASFSSLKLLIQQSIASSN